MITLTSNKDTVSAYADETFIGTIRLSENPYHKQNCYIELNLEYYDNAISAELFKKLAQMIQRPLQVMVNSDNPQITSFLTAGGFVLKRKCYEVEATKEDWIGTSVPAPLCSAHEGNEVYDLCCKLMYERYTDTHKDINPWTAGLSDFRNQLPSDVCYEADGDAIVNLAFVEENEIAYVYSADSARFSGFAVALVDNLFAEHGTVSFECDDCDWVAMRLREMFTNQEETSFDTYVFDYAGCAGEY